MVSSFLLGTEWIWEEWLPQQFSRSEGKFCSQGMRLILFYRWWTHSPNRATIRGWCGQRRNDIEEKHKGRVALDRFLACDLVSWDREIKGFARVATSHYPWVMLVPSGIKQRLGWHTQALKVWVLHRLSSHRQSTSPMQAYFHETW